MERKSKGRYLHIHSPRKFRITTEYVDFAGLPYVWSTKVRFHLVIVVSCVVSSTFVVSTRRHNCVSSARVAHVSTNSPISYF
jgi:hypothetical protein